ncbi:MAG: cobaltochelatase CobT-related protein [Holosporales bacterium]
MSGLDQTTKTAVAATIRAIAGTHEAVVTFGDSRSTLNAQTAHVCTQQKALVRGEADALALRLRYHNPRLMPVLADPLLTSVLEGFETARVEALGSRAFAGVAANLAECREAQGAAMPYETLHHLPDQGLVLAIRGLLCRAAAGVPLPPGVEQATSQWADKLAAAGKLSTNELLAVLDNQAAFLHIARTALERFLSLPEKTPKQEIHQSENPPADELKGEPDGKNTDAGEESRGGEAIPTGQPQPGDVDADKTEDGELEGVPVAMPGGRPEVGDGLATEIYRIFTIAYDSIAAADTLAAPEELAELRRSLDVQMLPYQNLVHRLAGRLQRLLMARQQTAWRFDEEEGIINSARLARLVTNANAAVFKQEHQSRYRETVVSLLLDNSGSMRGKPITTTALCADILAQSLEKVQVKVEILGFTTNTWKGGRAREDWIAAGKPTYPGRLNETRHIVYKAAGTPWRAARDNLGLMLKEGLLKENIDGEALLWAYQRLLVRPEPRRILLVLSDGAPVDDTTLSANGGGYLDAHLRSVITKIEGTGRVELAAVGIGHDVARYYQNAVTVNTSEDLAVSLVEQLEGLFKGQG